MILHNDKLLKPVMLCLGIRFLLFSNGRWFFPLAAWLYPFFMLYYTRKTKPLAGYITIAIPAAVCC